MSLPDIKAVLTASTEGFETALARAVRSSQTATDQIKEHTEKINQSFERLKGVAEAALAFFAIEKFKGIIEGSLEAAQKLDRLAQSTGIAVETLGGLGFAAHLADVDIDSAAAGFVKLDKSIAGAAAGNKEATAVYTALGISVRDASGQVKSADQVLVEAANKFAGYEDGANKTALAIGMFGKAGANLIPLLNQGGVAIEQNRQYYERYSGVTEELTKKAAEFEDTQKKIALLSGTFANTLTAQLLPALQGIGSEFLTAKENGNQFKDVASDLATILKGVATAATYVAQYIEQVTSRIGALAAAIPHVTGLLGDQYPEGDDGSNAVSEQKKSAAALKAIYEARAEDAEKFAARMQKLRDAINNKPPSEDDYSHEGRNQTRKKTEAPGIAQVKEAKEVIDPFVAYLDGLNKEGLKLNFDITNFDRFKGAAGTSKAALVEFDVEFGKFSDAARIAAKLPILTNDQKQQVIAAGKGVADYAEQLERVKALHAFDEGIKALQLQAENVGKNNEQIEISTKLLELEKSGIKAGTDAYAARIPVVTKAVHDLVLAQQQLQLATFAYGGSRAHDDALFQLSTIGKTRDQVQDLTAARQLDLEVQRQARDQAGNLLDPSGDQLAKLQAEADKQKAQLFSDNQAIRDQQRSAITGTQDFFNDYVETARDSATQVKQLLGDAYSGAEDAFVSFVSTGKVDFKSLVTSINSDIARIAFKSITTQGIESLKNLAGNDGIIGKILGNVGGTASSVAGAGGTAANSAAFTTLTATVTAANAPLAAMTAAASAAAEALSTVAASSVGGSAGAISGAGDALADSGLLELLASANGNVFNQGNLVPFANGGVVSRATIFPMRNGGTGLMGEAGPEAIIPLRRHPSGKLGIEGGQPVTNNYTTVNVPAPATRDLRSGGQYGRDIARQLRR